MYNTGVVPLKAAFYLIGVRGRGGGRRGAGRVGDTTPAVAEWGRRRGCRILRRVLRSDRGPVPVITLIDIQTKGDNPCIVVPE